MTKKAIKPESKVKPTVHKSYEPLGRGKAWGMMFLFLLLSTVLYFQTIHYGYVLDDKIVFSENNYVKKGIDGITEILSTETFQGYFGEQKNLVQGARYRPLSLISFAVEHQFFGLNASLSHVVNFLLYGLTVFLCFLTLRRLFKEKVVGKRIFLSIAFLSTVIFLFHPIHVEAVANVKGRDEILSLLLSMYTFLLCLKYADSRKNLLLLFIPIVFYIGLLAKENTITFLAIIPVGLWLFRPDNKGSLMRITGILFVTSLIYIMVRYQIIGYLMGDAPSSDLMNNSFIGMNGEQKYATIFYTLLQYLKLNVFPHPLTHDYYPYHIPIMEFSDWQVWVSIILHVILIGWMIINFARKKKPAFGLFFYIAAMSIVSNLVISIGTFMNERFAFAASLGICLIMAYILKRISKLGNDHADKILIGLVVILLGFYGYKTLDRVPAWESELTLNQAAIQVSKNSARANSFMATALFNRYKQTSDRQEKYRILNEAQPYARKATTIHPSYYNGHLMRVGIAAEMHKSDRKLDVLLSEFKEVMLVRPDITFLEDYLKYINNREDRNKMMAFYKDVCISNMIERNQNYSWAIKYLAMAYEMDPNDPEIRRGLRTAYIGLGQMDNANRFQ